jgi:Glycoside-hydrolase family GH114
MGACAALVSGCSAANDAAVDLVLPPVTGAFDYQLGEAYGEPGDFAVVGRDVSAEPLEGAYNVCYLNGFQTQPGALPDWEDGDGGALLRDASGAVVMDPEWPDEAVLDPSTPEQRLAILAVVGPQIRSCADAGFDAVELDNLDTFLRFDGVDRDGALALATAYVELGHDAGLAVGQKNAADVGADARETAGFDFAVVEECAAYDECGAYRDVYGEHVLQIEYTDDDSDAGDLALSLEELCALPDRAPLAVVRDRLLVGPDDPAYEREQCPAD